MHEFGHAVMNGELNPRLFAAARTTHVCNVCSNSPLHSSHHNSTKITKKGFHPSRQFTPESAVFCAVLSLRSVDAHVGCKSQQMLPISTVESFDSICVLAAFALL